MENVLFHYIWVIMERQANMVKDQSIILACQRGVCSVKVANFHKVEEAGSASAE